MFQILIVKILGERDSKWSNKGTIDKVTPPAQGTPAGAPSTKPLKNLDSRDCGQTGRGDPLAGAEGRLRDVLEGQKSSTKTIHVQGTAPECDQQNINFHFLLQPAFHLDHTFSRREELEHSKDVSYMDYFLVTKLAWWWEERKDLFFIEYLLRARCSTYV